MTHTYTISGITCAGCEARVKERLQLLPEISAADVSRRTGTVSITMKKHLLLSVLQQALGEHYIIGAMEHKAHTGTGQHWVITYKPVLLISAYILLTAFISGNARGNLHVMGLMNTFMAGFFLVFSFFKMLDLKGFAESYAKYDLVAGKLPVWGYMYAFIELGLGLAYASGYQPVITNIITLLVMSVSIAGVIKTVMDKRSIRCACLGSVFNLPMSKVTVIEDALMIAMSSGMLYMLAQQGNPVYI